MNGLYILLGPPRSGKTSQCSTLAETLDLKHISWGKIFRSQNFRHKHLKKFQLISDPDTSDTQRAELIADIICKKVLESITQQPHRDIILDGFPRRQTEAEKLIQILKTHNLELKALINLNTSLGSIISKSKHRNFCDKCGRSYNTSPNQTVIKYCPYDKSHLKPDDTSETDIAADFNLYINEIIPAYETLKPYAKTHFSVSGDESDSLITSKIMLKLNSGNNEVSPIFERKSETTLNTKYGEFQIYIYQSRLDYSYHLALTKGEVTNQKNVLTRVHSSCITGDILNSLHCDCGQQLNAAMDLIARENQGVLIYLFQEGRGINIINKIQAYELQRNGLDTVQANEKLGFPAELRQYDVVKNILDDLHINSIRLLTNNPDKVRKMTDVGVIVESVKTLEIKPVAQNRKYLSTKKYVMGHDLNQV